MKIEVRADSVNITDYVNVTGKRSKPVVTPHGKCIEVIEERAFADSLSKRGDVYVSVDHDSGHAYASTSAGTLELKEEANIIKKLQCKSIVLRKSVSYTIG